MKRLAAFMLALTMALSASACGGVDETADDTVSESEAVQNGGSDETDDGIEDETAAHIIEIIDEQLQAAENEDAEAFKETISFKAFFYSSFMVYGDYDEENIDELYDEAEMEEATDKIFDTFLERIDGMSLSHDVNELEIIDACTVLKGMEDYEEQYENIINNMPDGFDYYDISFSLYDEKSGENIKFAGTAFSYNGEWFLFFQPSETSNFDKYTQENDLKSAKSNARSAYIAFAEYIEDQEDKGISMQSTVKELVGVIDCSKPEDHDGALGEVAKLISEQGVDSGYALLIYMEGNEEIPFAVHWRKSDDSKFIGQYPAPLTQELYENGEEFPEWGEFKDYGTVW